MDTTQCYKSWVKIWDFKKRRNSFYNQQLIFHELNCSGGKFWQELFFFFLQAFLRILKVISNQFCLDLRCSQIMKINYGI